jgi:hypothetical protein
MTRSVLFRSSFLRLSASVLISYSLCGQTYRFACPAAGGGYLPVLWQPRYNAYIPLDSILGPTPCFSILWGAKTKLYKGDGFADIGDGWPVQSARVWAATNFRGSFNNGAFSFPATETPISPSAGQTRNYGWFSPVNGSTLSAGDEDEIDADCYKWNDAATAGTSTIFTELTRSGSTLQNGSARFYGTASNPLESSLANIAWGMRVNMDGNNPTDARVTTIDYNHTCFPSHIIKAQGFTTYYWGPPRSDPSYVFGCLVLQQGKIIGQSSPNHSRPN